MKRQSLLEYLRNRIEFQTSVALWMEFDVETTVVFEKPELEKRGDLSIPCMKFAAKAKKNPKIIAQAIKPYIEQIEDIERVEVVNGYINIFFDRAKFLLNIVNAEQFVQI